MNQFWRDFFDFVFVVVTALGIITIVILAIVAEIAVAVWTLRWLGVIP